MGTTQREPRQDRPLVILLVHGRGVAGPETSWLPLVKRALGATASNRRQALVLAPSYAHITGAASKRVRTRKARVPAPLRYTTRRAGGWVDDAERAEGVTVALRRNAEVLWKAGELRESPGEVREAVAGVGQAVWEDFREYLSFPGVKDAVRDELLRAIPPDSELVVVGHSMGSLVALDLLHDVPASVDVRGLITIGSPLSYSRFHSLQVDSQLGTAARRAEVWVNLVDPRDLVTGGAGVSSAWPAASHSVDIAVDNTRFMAQAGVDRHSAVAYLMQPAFVQALTAMIAGGRPLAPLGSRSDSPTVADIALGIRAGIDGRTESDVILRERLRAVAVLSDEAEARRIEDVRRRLDLAPDQQYRDLQAHPAAPRPTFSGQPIATMEDLSVVATLAWWSAMLWDGSTVKEKELRRVLTLAVGDSGLRAELPTLIAEWTNVEAQRLMQLHPHYPGQSPKSPLWVGGPRAHVLRLVGRRGVVVRVESADEAFCLALKWLVENRVDAALSPFELPITYWRSIEQRVEYGRMSRAEASLSRRIIRSLAAAWAGAPD